MSSAINSRESISVLPDQDLANLRFDPFELVRVLENLILDLLDVDAHILRSTLPPSCLVRWIRRQFSGQPCAGVAETNPTCGSPVNL